MAPWISTSMRAIRVHNPDYQSGYTALTTFPAFKHFAQTLMDLVASLQGILTL